MPTFTSAAVGITALLLLLGGSKKKKNGGKGTTPAGCPPFEYSEEQVDAAIASAIVAGKQSKESIASSVGANMWPTYPNGKSRLAWPPSSTAPDEVVCLWELLLRQIEDYLQENNIPPFPDCPAGTSINQSAGVCEPTTASTFDPTGYETPLNSNYPTHGTLLQVRHGDRLLGTFSEINVGQDIQGEALRSIAYTTLLGAAWDTAKSNGASDADAKKFAQDVAYDNSNRVDYIHLIQCSPWNDALYTTYGFGPQAMESPAGRALRFLPQHHDNRKRMMQGYAPRRNITLGDITDKGAGNAQAQSGDRNLAYLWLPKLNEDTLWDSGGKDITTNGVNWADGSSAIMPPPEVVELGVENVPEGAGWGCLGYEASSVGE